MVHPALLVLSGFSMIAAVVLVLFPQRFSELSTTLNRTLKNLDDVFMEHRYIIAGLLFLCSYLCFRLALMLPLLRG